MGKEGATPQLTLAKEGNAIVLPPLITPYHLFASQTTAKSAVSRVSSPVPRHFPMKNLRFDSC